MIDENYVIAEQLERLQRLVITLEFSHSAQEIRELAIEAGRKIDELIEVLKLS